MQVVNFGCRLNALEGEAIRTHLAAAHASDTIVVNTCAVTSEAEKQARQAIRRLRREHPHARIVVTGCAAQIAPSRYADMPEVDQVLGNLEKLRPEIWSKPAPGRISVADIMQPGGSEAALPPQRAQNFNGRPRAYLEVQQGCDHRCTFCIIPFGRGPSRSVPVDAIAAQARILAAEGFREFVLTGVDLTSYGRDLPGQPNLGQAARRLLALVPELARLRFSSLDPAAIPDDLIKLYADEPRVMPHAHLSLQAGDDLVLKRMKRRHSRADALNVARALRVARPSIALGADMIAGFPTEDDDAFANGAALIAELDLAYLHVFPYSARAGTPAARMPQVPVPVRRRRAAILRSLGQDGLRRHLARRIGRPAEILVEQSGLGRDETYAPVRLPPALQKGKIFTTTIAGVEDDMLLVSNA